jgi:hypothetical protein
VFTCRSAHVLGCAVLLLAVAAGCDKPPASGSAPASTSPNAEGEVRAAFAELQAVIRTRDADKLWSLLSARSRTEAEQSAKETHAAYEKADAAEKAKQVETLGLSGEKMARLTGPGFLETNRVRKKCDELADGKVTKVTAGADSATVYFDEPDGDHEKIVFVREDGRWKAWLAMPKTKKP